MTYTKTKLYKAPIPNPSPDRIKEKIRKLAGMMGIYAKKFNLKIEKLKNKLYEKYKVKSRIEMTEKQLQEAIESYKIALDNNIK